MTKFNFLPTTKRIANYVYKNWGTLQVFDNNGLMLAVFVDFYGDVIDSLIVKVNPTKGYRSKLTVIRGKEGDVIESVDLEIHWDKVGKKWVVLFGKFEECLSRTQGVIIQRKKLGENLQRKKAGVKSVSRLVKRKVT